MWAEFIAGVNAGGTTHDRVCVTQTPDHVYVSDAASADGPVLAFTWDEWSAFVKGAEAGEFTYNN